MSRTVSIQVCLAHPENTPDTSYDTNSSCRDLLLVRLARHDWRKSVSCSPRCRYIFCRCCALATLDDTLHQSSVVGYMCETIQLMVLSQHVETPAYGKALRGVQYTVLIRSNIPKNTGQTLVTACVQTRGALMGHPKLELLASNGVHICHAV